MKSLFIVFTVVMLSCASISAQTTAFTYQGSLQNGGTPANGNYDLEFKLFDLAVAGAQQGSTLQRLNVVVTNGVFTVSLDFGAGTLPGADRFLDISVRTASGGAFTPLTPRQKVNSAPYAVKSLNAASADSVTVAGVPSGSGNYIQNGTSPQASSNFSISGNGLIGGNIGIGTSAPTERLHVVGNGLFTGTLNAYNLKTPAFNTFVGNSAGAANTTGGQNVFMGQAAGADNTTGSNNVFVGRVSGVGNATESNNTFVGFATYATSPGINNSTAIGANATVSSSNSLILGAAGTNVGIGTTAPTERLHVVGNGLFTGGLTVNGPLYATLPPDSSSYIQNQKAAPQASSNFNISNDGFINGSGGVGTSSNTFLGTPARFTVVQQQPGQWAGHIGTNNFAAGNSFGLLLDAGTNSTDDAFRIRNQSGTSQFFSVKGNGFVGLGTANPNSHFHLQANAPQGFAIQMENTDTAKRFYFGNYGTVGGGNHWPGLDSANTSFLYAENTLVFTTPGGIMFSGSTTAEHMRIAANGNVGIGGVTEPTSTLQVNGQGRFSTVRIDNYVGGQSFALCTSNSGVNQFLIGQCSSSLRYKTNVRPFGKGLEILGRLMPISFDWKESGIQDIGFAAEDVEKTAPILTFRDDKGEVEGVRYNQLSAVIVNSIKEQQTQIEALQNTNAQQKAAIESQQRKNDELRKEVDELKAVVCSIKTDAEICKAKEK